MTVWVVTFVREGRVVVEELGSRSIDMRLDFGEVLERARCLGLGDSDRFCDSWMLAELLRVV